MIAEVKTTNFRRNLEGILNRVQCRSDSIVISKDGKPMAALISVELFVRILRIQERSDTVTRRIAEGYATIPVPEGTAEIEAAVQEERKLWRSPVRRFHQETPSDTQ